MRKRNDLRMTLTFHACDAPGGVWRRERMMRFFYLVLNLREDSSFMEICP